MNFNQKRNTVFYGWWVVGACFFIALYVGGIVFLGFTALVEPIANRFGWSYTQVSFAASLRGLGIGLLAPLMGFLVDRWGPRRLIFGGIIIVGLGFILLSRITTLGMFYGAFILIAIGVSTVSGNVLITTVVNWFRKKVGVAAGIVMSGYGLGGIMIPLVALLIDKLEWRTAMVGLALSIWGIALPLSLLIRHKPEHYGYLPDGEVKNEPVLDADFISAQSAEMNIQLKPALTSGTFWHIALASMLQLFAMSAVMTHVMPYLSSIGIARSVSSLVASALPVISVIGHLGFGWLADRVDKKAITAVAFAIMASGLPFFGYAATGGIWLLLPFLILFGIGWGATVNTRLALVREYFGRSRFGTIYGFISVVMMLGNLAGAPVAGWVFDKWGSYQGMWFALTGLTAAGAIIMLTTPPLKNTIQVADKPRA